MKWVDGGTARFILEMLQRCVGDLVAMQEPPHCCCLDLCQIWLRLAAETKKPCDLRGPPGVMEGLRGRGGRKAERERGGRSGDGEGELKEVGDI